MKKIVTLLLILFATIQADAQNKWFSLYSDSVALTADANTIINEMTSQVRVANPSIRLSRNKAIKNTTPYLIFIDLDSFTVNLPFWAEVIPEQKKFFAEVAGGEKEGKEVFGLFFNGFYLAHELGHSFSFGSGKKFDSYYDSEYDANIIAILFWRQTEKAKLERCYMYAKKMLQLLKNPVPANEDYKKYVTKHYDELSSDPYKYGYIQFSQFVEIYDNKALPDFHTFIKSYK